MKRFVKYVDYARKGDDRTVRQIVTIRVPGHRRVLNAPRAVLHLGDLGIKQVKFGF